MGLGVVVRMCRRISPPLHAAVIEALRPPATFDLVHTARRPYPVSSRNDRKALYPTNSIPESSLLCRGQGRLFSAWQGKTGLLICQGHSIVTSKINFNN